MNDTARRSRARPLEWLITTSTDVSAPLKAIGIQEPHPSCRRRQRGISMSSKPEVTVRQHIRDGFVFETRSVVGRVSDAVPVLLVGGAFQRKESWGRLEQFLLEARPVITVDLPGSGSADTLPADYDTDFLVDTLRQGLDELGVTHVDMAVGSYGAMIGYRMAQRHPELVGHLVVLACLTSIPDAIRPAVEHSLTLLREQRMEEFAAATVALFMCPDTDRTVVHRVGVDRILNRRFSTITADEAEKYVQNTLRLMARDHLEPEPAIRTPLLVVTGEHDTYTPPEISRRVARTSPHGVFALIADADHMVHLERPRETADLFLAHFEERPIEELPFVRVCERAGGAPARVSA
ncbi:alpha/beta fold hydrolase [Micromonospora matsumotoense]|uniref:alpha/beta fold hydrolase n=1 Tax=Micromonospora matsumotoense TaxID=121616 RepID=UPI00114CD748